MKHVSLGKTWDGLLGCRLALLADDVPALAAYAGKLLLVRPDRYVMARFDPGDASRIAGELEALLEQTWPSAGQPAAADARFETALANPA